MQQPTRVMAGIRLRELSGQREFPVAEQVLQVRFDRCGDRLRRSRLDLSIEPLNQFL